MIDLSLTEAQSLLVASVRDFVTREGGVSRTRHSREAGEASDRDLDGKLASLGFYGLAIPEQFGGAQVDWQTLALFYEVLGTVMLPTNHWSSAVLAARLLTGLGTRAQQEQFLPRIADGSLRVVVAYREATVLNDFSGVACTAHSRAHRYLLAGHKAFVRHAGDADYFIVFARADDGLGLFLIPARQPGFSLSRLQVLGGEPLWNLALKDVEVSIDARLAAEDVLAAFADIVGAALVLTASEMIGGAQGAMEMAVAYAKSRVAFGRPIGSFQAIQHKLADVYVKIAGARLAVYHAAWLLDHALDSRQAHVESSLAVIVAAEAFRVAAEEAVQVHGGLGIMRDHDIHLYYERAKAFHVLYGANEFARNQIADLLLSRELPLALAAG